MKLLFLEYLTYIRTTQPIVLEGCDNIVAECNKKGANVLIKILQGFPFSLDESPPFDPTLIPRLANTLQTFFYTEEHIVSSMHDMDESREQKIVNLEQGLAENVIIREFINEIIAIACGELLDENGQLHEAIEDFFGLNRILNSDSKILREFFIKSYINKVVIPAINYHLSKQTEFRQNRLARVSTTLMSERIFININKRLAGDNLSENDSRLKAVINKVQNNRFALAKIHTVKIEELVEAIYGQIIIAKAPDETFSLFNFANDMVNRISGAQPVSFEVSAEKLLKAVFTDELNRILDSAYTFMKVPLKMLVDRFLTFKLKDIDLYGKLLAKDFENNDYIKYLRANANEQGNDYPVVFFDKILFAPFNQKVISDLTNYFHEELIMQSAEVENFEEYEYLHFFVRKIILFSYSQILDNQGNVKIEIINLGAGNDLPAPLISAYLRKMLITIFACWLANKECRDEFTQQNLSPSTLDDLIDIIEATVTKGLSLDFLNQLYGFPTSGNRELAPRFVIPLSISSTGSASIKSVINEIKDKLHLVIKTKKSYSRFLTKHQESLASLKTQQTQIQEKMAEYTAVMAKPAQMLKGVKSIVSVFGVACEDFQENIAKLDHQPETLKKLLQELKSTYATEPLHAVKERVECFSSQKTLYLSVLTVTEAAADTLLGDLISIRSYDQKIVSIAEFCTDMNTFMLEMSKLVKEKAGNALIDKKRYLLRDKFFPREIYNSVGWNNQMEEEEDLIKNGFIVLKAESKNIQTVCENMKVCKFSKLITNDGAALREEVSVSMAVLARQKSLILSSANTIKTAVTPLFTMLESAKAHHEEIYKMLVFILRDAKLWKNCVSPFWGGVNYSVGRINYTFPTRIVAMMKAEEALDPATDPDLKITAILLGFINTPPGYGIWRYNVTKEFYKVIGNLKNAASKNLYKVSELEVIKTQLKDFMKKNCKDYVPPQAAAANVLGENRRLRVM